MSSSDSDGEEHDRSRSPRLALQQRIACIATIYGLIENHLPMHKTLDRVGTLFEYTVDKCKKLLTRLADPLLVQVGITHNPLQRVPGYFKAGFHRMLLVAQSACATTIESVEAHLIAILPLILNRTIGDKWIEYSNVNPSAEGKMRCFDGPYYCYLAVKHCAVFRDEIPQRNLGKLAFCSWKLKTKRLISSSVPAAWGPIHLPFMSMSSGELYRRIPF